MSDSWKKRLKRFIHDFRGYAKDVEVANTNKAAVEMVNNLHLCVDVANIKDLLEWFLRS